MHAKSKVILAISGLLSVILITQIAYERSQASDQDGKMFKSQSMEDYLPGRNRATLERWLNSLPHDESQFLRHNLMDYLIQLSWYVTPLFDYCDNNYSQYNVDCQSFVPNPGAMGDMTYFSVVRGTHYNPNHQVTYTIPKFNADTIPGFNVTAYNPNFNAPGTGTTIPFSVYYNTGDPDVLCAHPNWPKAPIAYNSIPPYGPVNNAYFTASNVGFHVPYDSLPIPEGVLMQPVIWAIGSCQAGNDYRPSIEHHASQGRLVIVPEVIPGICTDFNSTDFDYIFAIDYMQIVQQVYGWSQSGSGHVLEGRIDWSRPILLGHSEGNVQLMTLLAGYAAANVPRFSLLADADTLYLPRDAPADNLPYATLQNISVKLHQYVSGQRGLGEMSAERLMGANQDQYYNDMSFFPPIAHETFAVGEQREAEAAIASGNCHSSPYWYAPCQFIYAISANPSLAGSIVSPDGMSAFTNK